MPTDPASHTPPGPAGLLVLDKPLGKTSMQACAAIRARLRLGGASKRIKVGHGGTLDPLATGVLVILVGKATKRQDTVMAGSKSYLAEVDLAHTSRTDDAEGPVEPANCQPVDRGSVEARLPAFVGRIMQRPPAFSAMKIGGRRAYALARRAETDAELPELEQRPVQIDAIELTAFQWPIATLRIDCGKGTYIRSLARDLGAALGTGGMLRALQRTRVGRWTIDDAVTLDSLPDTLTQADLRPMTELESPPPDLPHDDP
ncbi:MAG: tRNA pseudouridine(55) synthase TruB [Planctomycetota bacterium]